MSKSKIRFDFKVGYVNNRGPSLTVIANQQPVYFGHPAEGKLSLEFDIEFPSHITIEVGGKDVMDTIVDENNEIVADKYILVQRVSIDNMPIKRNILENKMFGFIQKSDQQVRWTNYFGQNGHCDLIWSDLDSFDLLLRLHTD